MRREQRSSVEQMLEQAWVTFLRSTEAFRKHSSGKEQTGSQTNVDIAPNKHLRSQTWKESLEKKQ